MTPRILLASSLTVAILTTPLSVSAQEMDVDQADTLRFDDFHTDKNAAIKAWEKKPEATKTYRDETAQDKKATTAESVSNNTGTTAATKASDEAGKHFEMRERYTLTRSAKTPYSAFYVIEPLYKQAAQLCPKGWKKLAERSEPVEQDFYLYYEIECL